MTRSSSTRAARRTRRSSRITRRCCGTFSVVGCGKRVPRRTPECLVTNWQNTTPRLRELVEPGVALFAHFGHCAGLAHAVGDPLGHRAVDVELFGQVSRVKRLRQLCWAAIAADRCAVEKRYTSPTSTRRTSSTCWSFASAPAFSAVPRKPPFLDFHQRDFQREIDVRKHACEMDQLAKQIERGAAFRAPALRDDGPATSLELG